MGETGQPFHCRMNGHCSDIMHSRIEDSPMAAHLDNDPHSQADMTVMVIDQARNPDSCLHNTQESRLSRTLRTLFPSEMNLQVDSL